MINLDAPIVSLEQAQAYFKAMGCNHFHLDRESLARRDEYRAMAISKVQERAWRIEEFDKYLAQIVSEADSEQLWHTHSRLLDLLPSFDGNADLSTAYFAKLLDATRHAAAGVMGRDRIIMAETIIGRTAHRTEGMIVKAFALNRQDFADELFAIVDHLLSSEDGDNDLARRRGNAKDNLQELRLKVTLANPFALLEMMQAKWKREREAQQ